MRPIVPSVGGSYLECPDSLLERRWLMPDGNQTGPHGSKRRVRIPLFPTYSELRHLLKVWGGRPKSGVMALRSTIADLTGTVVKPVDWSDPDTWIPQRLDGEDAELAHALWAESGKTVNPRHITGHWLLSQKYELLVEGADGTLVLTDHGRDFIDHPLGETEQFLDEQEGLIEILTIVVDSGPARIGAFVEPWGEFLGRHSRYGTASTIKDTLRRRLNNLRDRELVSREHFKYEVTKAGVHYLERVAPPSDADKLHAIRKLAKKREASVRGSLHDHLLKMDPTAFERLIGRVLVAMDYENVQVIGQSGDGGVDVVADIELGVTSVREVVQAKRHKRTIQRKDLDALRGSLYRFNAVRGTIVTTSRFARGTKDAAFAQGAAPVTLIDGSKLIDMLIEHDIGVRKHSVEVLSVDVDGLVEAKDVDEEGLAGKQAVIEYSANDPKETK